MELSNFIADSIKTVTMLATAGSTFFLVKGGLGYITSAGNPEALERAKKTIKNALIGLVIVLSAYTFSTILSASFNTYPTGQELPLPGIEEKVVSQDISLGKIIGDAIGGLISSVIKSAADPVTKGIIYYLKLVPTIATNPIIFKFWIVILGITDTLFALMIALIGLQFMSATTFGFEEVELKQILPKIGLAFLLANSSIFLIDWIVKFNGVLVNTVFSANGEVGSILTAITLNPFTALFAQILTLFLIILCIALLLLYINRLIVIAVGAVLSPLFCLLWISPKFSDFVDLSVKTYLTTIFTTFVQSVILILGVSFLSIGAGNDNWFISSLMGIGLILVLLKTSSTMMYLMAYNSGRALIKKVGGEIMNVISSSENKAVKHTRAKAASAVRKVAKA